MDVSDTFIEGRSDRRIAAIAVDDLHGRYSYNLVPGQAESMDSERLVILYGDNGSGKTSILRLLFHLLANAQNRNHRTAVAQIMFRRFSVVFSDAFHLVAERPLDKLQGSYSLLLSKDGEIFDRVNVKVNDEGVVTDSENPGLDEFYDRISKELRIEPFLVGDDRRLLADSLPSQSRSRHVERYVEDEMGRVTFLDTADTDAPTAELILTLERATQWLRQQAFRASTRGSETANTIYADLLRRFSQPWQTQIGKSTLEESVRRLSDLSERNQAYERFGLVPRLNLETITEAVEAAPDERAEAIQGLLQPFAEVLEARLSAVQNLQEALSAYQDSLNSFYWDKRITISLQGGVLIESLDGDAIPPGALSSGERQLLMVLTNVLFARDSGALFIVDEPEISLNTKWQRRLIDTLLSCTRMSGAQFILATHSFEILSSYRDRVVQLTPSSSEAPSQLEFDGE